jgi:hypothetical protein
MPTHAPHHTPPHQKKLMLGLQIKSSIMQQNVTVTNFSNPHLLITTNGSK